MIEFTLSRGGSGKKSRWAKKYPRKRILKRGSEKAAGWYFHKWSGDILPDYVFLIKEEKISD